MARFVLPAFPTAYLLWLPGHTPFSDPPDVTGQMCQMYYGPNQAGVAFTDFTGQPEFYRPMAEFRFPPDSYGIWGGPVFGGVIQVDDIYGNKWSYLIIHWDYHHMGFANMYISMMCVQCDPDSNPPDNSR